MMPDPAAWALKQVLTGHVERHWTEPDEGIWEVRSGRQHFTHSKVMAWVAVDRAVQAVERFGLPGPAGRWRALRTRMHEEICTRGVDPGAGASSAPTAPRKPPRASPCSPSPVPSPPPTRHLPAPPTP